MVKAAYQIVFSIIKKIRGLPLEDLPNNWITIMETFDQRRQMERNTCRLAEQLLKETSGYLRIIGAIDGQHCDKYIVASNSIAYNALQIIQPTVESLSNKAVSIDLQLWDCMEVYNQVCEAQIILYQICKLGMIADSTAALSKELKEKLAVAERLVNIFCPSK